MKFNKHLLNSYHDYYFKNRIKEIMKIIREKNEKNIV